MIVLGLTGSIGMGKSTAATMLSRMGLPIHDADAAVHRLMQSRGGAVAEVAAAFPGVESKGAIDRALLGQRVFGDAAALARLEAILHPLVRAEAHSFLRRAARRRCDIVVLDIPLLFETGGERLCDVVAVVTAPRFVQTGRVLARAGMSQQRLATIRAKQMAEADKRRRADFVVQTGLGKDCTLRQLATVIRLLRAAPALWRRRYRPY